MFPCTLGANVGPDCSIAALGNGDMMGAGFGASRAALAGRFKLGASFHPGMSRRCAAGIGGGVDVEPLGWLARGGGARVEGVA